MAGTRHKRGSCRNVIFGAIFFLLSSVFGIHSYLHMPLGTASDMGPGFFPLILSVTLAALSVSVAFSSSRGQAERLCIAPLRAMVLTLGAPVTFALSVRSLGMVAAVAFSVFLSSLASRISTLGQAAFFTVSFTTFCVLVFGFLLELPIPLWRRFW